MLTQAGAQNNLGNILRQRYPPDFVSAVMFFSLAAEQNNSEAIYNLGCCYGNGQGAPQDWIRACELFQQSCDLGYPLGPGMLFQILSVVLPAESRGVQVQIVGLVG